VAPEIAPSLQGIKTGAVKRGINNMLNEPGTRASKVARKTLTELQESLAELTDEFGLVNAEDLYTLRKEIGNSIKKHAKDTGNWDTKMTAGLERRIQQAMDDAIENAGGKGWRDYLATYAKQSEGIGRVKQLAEAKKKPLERANMTGAKLGEKPQLPNAFSREILITNAILRAVTPDMTREYALILAKRYLNPAEQARILRGESLAPSTVAKMRRAVALAGAAGAPSTIDQTGISNAP
jgi:hypothetical protein